MRIINQNPPPHKPQLHSSIKYKSHLCQLTKLLKLRLKGPSHVGHCLFSSIISLTQRPYNVGSMLDIHTFYKPSTSTNFAFITLLIIVARESFLKHPLKLDNETLQVSIALYHQDRPRSNICRIKGSASLVSPKPINIKPPIAKNLTHTKIPST